MKKNRPRSLSHLSLTLTILAGFVLVACGGLRSELGSIFGGFEEQPDIGVVGEAPTLEVVETVFDAAFDTGMSGSICPGDNTLDIGDPPGVIGEKNDAVDCEGFWTFNIQGIPPTATVTNATFDPGACTVSGAPFAYSDLGFEFVDVGSLDLGDYGAGGVGYNTWNNCPPFGIDMTAYVQSRVSGQFANIQIRAYFVALSFGDGATDAISYRTGNPPSLTIRYY